MGTHSSGHPRSLEVTNFPVTIKEQIVGVYGICRDITDRKEQKAQIISQATCDLLTGLPNEASFEKEQRRSGKRAGPQLNKTRCTDRFRAAPAIIFY
jgi:PleD family two-component response regulator